jgi:hypothetical protein
MGTVMLGKLADKINPMLSPLFTSPSPPSNFQGSFKAAALAEIAQLFAGGLRPSKKKNLKTQKNCLAEMVQLLAAGVRP